MDGALEIRVIAWPWESEAGQRSRLGPFCSVRKFPSLPSAEVSELLYLTRHVLQVAKEQSHPSKALADAQLEEP